jgi:hypothetical protein
VRPLPSREWPSGAEVFSEPAIVRAPGQPGGPAESAGPLLRILQTGGAARQFPA